MDVIPKIYTSINLDPLDLAYLINLFSSLEFGDDHKGKDIFGRIYEYFLGKFAETEGKKGGEFYTPRSLTKLIVEILDVKVGEYLTLHAEAVVSLFAQWRKWKEKA